jgi:hypothetical protein
MAEPFELPLPPDFDLDDNFQIRVTALDPATGNVVAGVNVGTVTLMVDNLLGGDLTSGSFGPFLLVPGQQA